MPRYLLQYGNIIIANEAFIQQHYPDAELIPDPEPEVILQYQPLTAADFIMLVQSVGDMNPILMKQSYEDPMFFTLENAGAISNDQIRR